MTGDETTRPPVLTMLVSRQLDTMSTGNAAYLMVFLRAAKLAGHRIRIAAAPRRSFGNRPWADFHQAFLDLDVDIAWPGALRVGRRFWSLSPVVWGRFAVRLGKELFRKLGVTWSPLVAVRSHLADVLDPREARELAKAADTVTSEIVVAEYSSLGPVLGLLHQTSRRAALLHDLFSMRAAAFRAHDNEADFTEMTLGEEADRVKDADTLFLASANELAALAPLTPQADCVWLRPEMPAHNLSPSEGPPRAVFLGTRHAGNTDSVRHLIRDIWPLVRARSPSSELWIAGSTCTDVAPSDAAVPGVRLLGRVEDLGSIGGASSIGVAPTRIASGVSIKVAEYLQLGMPCIAYRVALEGYGDVLDDLVEVVDDPAGFADRLVAWLEDAGLRSTASARGLEQVSRRLDNKATIDRLRQFRRD